MLSDTDRKPSGREEIPAVADVSNTFVSTAGYKTHLLYSGKDRERSMLLLHGGGPGVNAWINWRYALPFFGLHFNCLAPDLVGFGQTDHPDPPPSGMAGWSQLRVEQLLAVLDTLGIQQAHLVGQSRGGGMLALKLLESAPDRVKRVVLMGAAGISGGSEKTAVGSAGHSDEGQNPATFYDAPSQEAMAEVIASFVYDVRSLEGVVEEMAAQRFKEAVQPEARRSFKAMYSSVSQGSTISENMLRQVSKPILLVHGREDRMVPVGSSYYLLQHLHDAQLHVYPKCGHWVQIEHQDSFHRLVLDFLSGDI